MKLHVNFTANDCSFEDGSCGWGNYESPLSVEWGNWTIFSPAEGEVGNWTVFSPAEGEAAEFKGLQNDATFPQGQGKCII